MVTAEHSTKEELLRKPATSTRYIKRANLLLQYSEAEAKLLLQRSRIYRDFVNTSFIDSSTIAFAEEFKKRKIEQAHQKKKHCFTVAEDDFITRNYKHLSDNTIGLALNIPSKSIKFRRKMLNLVKYNINSKGVSEVIIWNNRSTFEEDCKKFNLTKARG